MKAIANIPNWHRYIIGTVIVVLAILEAVIAAPTLVPPTLHDIVAWAPFVALILGAFLAALPRVQTQTGPGAPPILSPPPPGVKTVPLVEKWVPPTD